MPSLVSVDEWGDYSKSPAPENAQALLDAASGAIRAYCGWNITRQVVEDEEFDTYGSNLLVIPTMLVVSIDAIYECDLYLEDGIDYRWSKRGLIRRRPKGVCWPDEYGAVRGSYTHGYETCPVEVAALCVAIAKRNYAVPSGIAQKQVGGISLQYKDVQMDGPEKGILDPYALESGRDN